MGQGSLDLALVAHVLVRNFVNSCNLFFSDTENFLPRVSVKFFFEIFYFIIIFIFITSGGPIQKVPWAKIGPRAIVCASLV